MREADGKPLNEKPKQRRSGRIHRVMDAAIISRTIDARTIIHVYQIIMQLADVTKQQCPPVPPCVFTMLRLHYHDR